MSRSVRSTVKKTIDVVHTCAQFAIINKPSGVKCFGNHDSNCLLPQLTSYFKKQSPNQTLDPQSIQILHRLDRFVTGGIVVGREKKFAHLFSKSLKNKGSTKNMAVNRYYVGLMTIPADFDSFQEYARAKLQYKVRDEHHKGLVFDSSRFDGGEIRYDITSFAKDYRKRYKKGPASKDELVTQLATTRFRLLSPYARQEEQYSGLFKDRLLVPIAMKLETGRKNQIRDHIHQAFDTTLLNDDNFIAFKGNSRAPRSPNSKGGLVNSVLYRNNQIGLHSVKIEIDEEEWNIPLGSPDDKWLWGDLINKNGYFGKEVMDQVLSLG